MPSVSRSRSRRSKSSARSAGSSAADGRDSVRSAGHRLLAGTRHRRGLAAGVFPLARLPWARLGQWVREGGRTSGESLRHGRLRRVLVMGEVALTLAVVCGATLLVKSAVRLQSQNPGFVALASCRSASVSPRRIPTSGRSSSTRRSSQATGAAGRELRRLLARSAAEHAGRRQQLHDRRRYQRHCRTGGVAEWNTVSPGYFETLGIPVLEGRAFATTDTATAPVALVNQSFVRATLPRTKRDRQTAERWRLGREGTVDDDHRRRRRRAVHGRRLGWIASDLLRAGQPESMAAIGARHCQDRRRSRAARRRQHGVKRVHSMLAFRCATWRR